jgi:hypothetical protein
MLSKGGGLLRQLSHLPVSTPSLRRVHSARTSIAQSTHNRVDPLLDHRAPSTGKDWVILGQSSDVLLADRQKVSEEGGIFLRCPGLPGLAVSRSEAERHCDLDDGSNSARTLRAGVSPDPP